MNKQVDYIGIISPFDLLKTSLKREVLFFDKIAIPNVLKDFIFKDILLECPIRAIEYLIDAGIIIDPVKDFLGDDLYLKKIGQDIYEQRLNEIDKKERHLAKELKSVPAGISFPTDLRSFFEMKSKNLKDIFIRFGQHLQYKVGLPFLKIGVSFARFGEQLDYDRRGMANDLRQKFSVNAFPAYSDNVVFNDDFIDGQNDVVKLVIESLPEPDYESVSWEQIIDFRNDPESKMLLKYLRHWITGFSKQEATYNNLFEELTYYCAKYEEHIRLHKMKLTNGVLETLLMIPVEMIEGVIRLKPTKTLDALFKFKKQKVQLLEQEMKAPGRDLAYILKARDRFDE